MSTRYLASMFLVALSACSVIADDAPECTGGKCDGGGVDQTCKDPHYGDGTCDLKLDCGVPDIDCFTTFATDADAVTWFTGIEQRLATEQGRAPRAILPETDPRWKKARDLLDRGWAAFREHRPVGQLRDRRPSLVLLDDPTVNAFVMPDLANMKSALSVQVQTGLIEQGGADDAMLGVMMHELQHAVGNHLIGDTRDAIRRFYAVDGSEPIGRDEADDPRVREPVLAWRTAAAQISFLDNAELGGFPLAGQLGDLTRQLTMLATQMHPDACAHASDLVAGIKTDLHNALDPLDLHVTADLSAMPARVDAALAALRDECMAGFPTYIEVVAELTNQTPDQVSAALTAHDRDLVTGKHVVDGIAALAADRRAAMRDAEAAFTASSGLPWTAVRYFSTEEDADDTSVMVLRAAKLDPAGLAAFLPALLPEAARATCTSEVASGTVPGYGVDLSDDHHATCWRVYHVHAYAAATGAAAARTIAHAPVSVRVPGSLGLPEHVSDHVMY